MGGGFGGSFGNDQQRPEAPWGTSTGITCNTCGKAIRFGRETHRQGNTFTSGRWKITCPGRFCTKDHAITDAEANALQAAMAGEDPRNVCLVLRQIARWTYPYKDLEKLTA